MSNFPAGSSLDRVRAGLGPIGRRIARMLERVAARMREERSRRELMQLNDHMLKDIGLSRIEIRSRRLRELNRAGWTGRAQPSAHRVR